MKSKNELLVAALDEVDALVERFKAAGLPAFVTLAEEYGAALKPLVDAGFSDEEAAFVTHRFDMRMEAVQALFAEDFAAMMDKALPDA